jgi:hypothetical protein
MLSALFKLDNLTVRRKRQEQDTMNNPITRLFRYLTATAPVVQSRSNLPVLASPTLVAVPQRATQLSHALQSLNDEFGNLNVKLIELRDSLENLRDALKNLDEANRRRAAQNTVMLIPKRIDLN